MKVAVNSGGIASEKPVGLGRCYSGNRELSGCGLSEAVLTASRLVLRFWPALCATVGRVTIKLKSLRLTWKERVYAHRLAGALRPQVSMLRLSNSRTSPSLCGTSEGKTRSAPCGATISRTLTESSLSWTLTTGSASLMVSFAIRSRQRRPVSHFLLLFGRPVLYATDRT